MPRETAVGCMQRVDPAPGVRRRATAAAAALLALLGGCASTGSGPSAPLEAQLSSPLPSTVPVQTPLLLTYSASRDAYGSLYNAGTSGQVVALFENRALRAGVTEDFPGRAEPVIRLGAPAGREAFIFVASVHPLAWLNSADYVDHTLYPRLRFDRRALIERLDAAIARLPPGSGQMRSLDITVLP